MGLDIFVYKRCNNCRALNQVEVYRTENEPFDINNDEHWALLRQVFRHDIEQCKKEYAKLDESEKDNRNEDAYLDEKDYIAQSLKFSDEGAFTFVNCEKCNKPLMFYIVSV